MPIRAFLNRLRNKGGGATRAPAAVTAPPEPRPVYVDAGKNARITLYFAWWDSDSRYVLREVARRGWPTHYVDLGEDSVARVALLSAHQRRQLPVVLLDGALLGGRKEIDALTRLPEAPPVR